MVRSTSNMIRWKDARRQATLSSTEYIEIFTWILRSENQTSFQTSSIDAVIERELMNQKDEVVGWWKEKERGKDEGAKWISTDHSTGSYKVS